MNPALLAWLRAQLGPATNEQDLTTRYARLGRARTVAAEVLAERRATLLAEPLRMNVDGVVTIDQTNNLAGLERQIAALEDLVAPDDPAPGEAGPDLVSAPLQPVRRTR
ncbi:hypothetical protein [Streptomyces flavofungini]|uniref:hypothetical protein n=1 Tax=Streptomyces flavofungini TaxID=68200 RepID=UPI0025AF80BD|nr:hypothetical protein [Streptomyces flavofungini]WJV48880.1 hypothetical protein QUY26_27235 [Streptomyces flavofungini]